MTASQGARPKRKVKNSYDPDFFYEGLSVQSPFSDESLKQQNLSLHPVRKRPRHFLIQPREVPSWLSHSTSNFSCELELKVLDRQRQCPLEAALSDLRIDEAHTTDAAVSRKPKRSIDWPQDFVPGIQGKYDILDLSKFVSGYLLMIKGHEIIEKEALLSQLELLMRKSISYT